MKSTELIKLDEQGFLALISKVVEHLKVTGHIQDEWIPESEASKLLNLKRVALYQLRSSGAIEYSKIGRKVILYKKSSLLQFIQKHAQKTF